MTSLAERIELVMGWRGLSSRKWAEQAGLSPNALNTFLKRARVKPKAHLNGRTLIALARAAQVNSDWLSSGRGDPEPQTVAPAETKELIAALGKASGLPDAVLQAFRAYEQSDASPLFWMSLLLTLSQGVVPPKALPRAKAH